MTLTKELNAATAGYTTSELLALTEQLYAAAKLEVSAGCADPLTIRACNEARKEIETCKKNGYGN